MIKTNAILKVGEYKIETSDGYKFILKINKNNRSKDISTVNELSNSLNSKSSNKTQLSIKNKTVFEMENILETAEWVGRYEREDRKNPLEIFESKIKIKDEIIDVKILVKMLDDMAQIYDIVVDDSLEYKKYSPETKKARYDRLDSVHTGHSKEHRAFDDSIARDDEDVKKRITKSDSEGNKLSPKQQEYFNDSVVRDDNGNLLVVYHGSRNEFTIFDRSKAGESNTEAKIGFWFTTSEKGAKSFSNSVWYGDNDEALAYKGYLNIKNPKIYEETKFDKEYVDSLHKEKRELEKQLN